MTGEINNSSFFSSTLGSIDFVSLTSSFFIISPFVDIEPKVAPTSTTEPSLEIILSKTPEAGEGTSKFTLSVSNSTIGSSASTASPSLFNHLETVASTMLSPSTGTKIFSLILLKNFLQNFLLL